MNLTCPTGEYFSSITIVPSCSSVSYPNLTNFPSACSSNYFVTAIAASPTCTQVSWTGLANFPAACSAGEFVTAVGSTLTCAAATFSISTTTCAAGSAVVQAAASTVSCSAVNPSISTTSCGADSAVVQGATSTISCLAQPFISTAATVSCASQNYVTTLGTATAVCAQPFTEAGPLKATQHLTTSVAVTITSLSVTLGTSTTYSVLAWIPYQCAATNGVITFGVFAPTGSTLSLSFYASGAPTNGIGIPFNYGETATSITTLTTNGCPTVGGNGVYVSGYITTSTTSGAFGFITAGNENSNTYTIELGSWLVVTNPAA